MNVYPGPTFYNRVDAEAIRAIVAAHLQGGHICSAHLYRPRIEKRQRW
jgi:(2Fe-2S) ferredoxin